MTTKVPPRSELLTAMKAAMERVPALAADGRERTVREVTSRLAAQGVPGAALLAKADRATLETLRAQVLRDGFSAAPVRSVGDTARLPGPSRTAVVSGGSYTGLLAAAALAKGGYQVTVLEPRPQHTRDIRLSLRQGTLDMLAAVDPQLAAEVAAKASPLDAADAKALKLPGSGQFVPLKGQTEGRHAPDAAQAPATGAALMATPFTHVIVASDLEEVIEAYVRRTFPKQVTVLEGKLHAEPRADGQVTWGLERKGKDGAPVVEDFLHGARPGLVIVAEGAGSSTRAALGIESAASTPTQEWTAGVVHAPDPSVAPGHASIHSLLDKAAEGTTRGVALADRSATWVLAQSRPGFEPDSAAPQEQIDAQFYATAAVVTGQPESTLRRAGATGPIRRDGSVPTLFELQGKASRDAALTVGDTVVGFIGDSVLTSTFQVGGGMNGALGEVETVMALAADLQSGVSPKDAAQRFETSVFERADAWSAAGIPFFYETSSREETQALVQAHLEALAQFRASGGASPLERLQAMLAQVSVASEPLGLPLAA